MSNAQVRSFVNLPEIARGQTGTLPDDARLRGLLAAGLVERTATTRPTPTALTRDLRTPQTDPPAEVQPEVVPQMPSGTIRDVLDWVGDDVARADTALDDELRSTAARSTLVNRLLAIVDTPPGP